MGNANEVVINDTKEKIAIMQAFVDKKTVEYYTEEFNIWLKVVSPIWNWEKWEYRIKPELQYQRFDFTDAEKLIGKVVKSKNNDYIGMIKCAYADNNFIVIGESRVGYDRLFTDFLFLDDSICGKLKQ